MKSLSQNPSRRNHRQELDRHCLTAIELNMVMTNRKTNTLALDAANAKHKVRLIDFEAGEYLHMSGVGTTKKLDWAWLGFAKQAEVLKQRAEERGEVGHLEPSTALSWSNQTLTDSLLRSCLFHCAQHGKTKPSPIC